MQIRMTRIDPDRNMKRFYAIDLQRELFGQWECVRSWGRIGSRGRCVKSMFRTQQEAAEEADKWYRTKRRRGYM